MNNVTKDNKSMLEGERLCSTCGQEVMNENCEYLIDFKIINRKNICIECLNILDKKLLHQKGWVKVDGFTF